MIPKTLRALERGGFISRQTLKSYRGMMLKMTEEEQEKFIAKIVERKTK